jgi:hypothetical protein
MCYTQDRRFSIKLAEASMKNDEMLLKKNIFYIKQSPTDNKGAGGHCTYQPNNSGNSSQRLKAGLAMPLCWTAREGIPGTVHLITGFGPGFFLFVSPSGGYPAG